MLRGRVSNRNTFVGAGDVSSSTGWRTLDHCLSDLFGTALLRFCWGEPGRPRNTAAAASSAGPGVRWRDCESADRRRADCSPGAGGCALVTAAGVAWLCVFGSLALTSVDDPGPLLSSSMITGFGVAAALLAYRSRSTGRPY